MTMQDFLVVGIGTIVLFAIFVTARVLYESGTVDVWGLLRRYVAVRVIDDEAVPRQFGSSSASTSGASRDLLPAHGHQEELDFDADQEPALRQLSRVDLIVLLAVQRKEDGNYLWSSNEIKKFVGGRAETVGDTIAAVRGTTKAVQGTPLKRPLNGW